MTLSSPQLVPVVPPLDIRVSAAGTFFVVILPEPDDLEWFEELLKGTGKIEANREFLVWKRVWIKEERGYYDPWELEKFLQEAWLEIHEESAPAPPPMLALPPAPPEVGKGTRGLIQMAEEMGVDYRELEMRLRNGWPYKVTERKATLIPIDGTAELEHRVEYFFNKAAAKWNVENRDKVKEPARKRPVEYGESEDE